MNRLVTPIPYRSGAHTAHRMVPPILFPDPEQLHPCFAYFSQTWKRPFSMCRFSKLCGLPDNTNLGNLLHILLKLPPQLGSSSARDLGQLLLELVQLSLQIAQSLVEFVLTVPALCWFWQGLGFLWWTWHAVSDSLNTSHKL